MKIDITLTAAEAREICAARIKNETNLSPSHKLNVTIAGAGAGAARIKNETNLSPSHKLNVTIAGAGAGAGAGVSQSYRVDHPHDAITALCSVRYGLGDLNGTVAPGSKIEAIKRLRCLFVTNPSVNSPLCLADSKTSIELEMNTVIAYILTHRTLNGIYAYVRSFDP